MSIIDDSYEVLENCIANVLSTFKKSADIDDKIKSISKFSNFKLVL